MYQTKPRMSTCEGGFGPQKPVKIGLIWPISRYFLATGLTSVTCPIFRPGRKMGHVTQVGPGEPKPA